MPSFAKDYAAYYDAFYAHKDYAAEAHYVKQIIAPYATSKTLLELGCGSGKYTREFSKMGFSVVGLDISSEMLEIAKAQAPSATYCCADMGKFALNTQFDAVVSLFHCIGYQVENTALLATFGNVAAHLKNGGVFVFDVWYGPAVLEQKPEIRTKRVCVGDRIITRRANPRLCVNDNVVEVCYEITIAKPLRGESRDPANAADSSLVPPPPEKMQTRFSEIHKMRYFFLPEIDLLAKSCGLNLIRSEAFFSGQKLDQSSWGACFVLQK